jgi:glucokinase
VQVLGLDVGGTTIKSGLVNSAGDLTDLRRTPTPQDKSGEQLVAALSELVTSYKQTSPELSAVGLCVPGIVDSENGIAVWSGTLGWRDLPLASMLSRATGLPVKLVHDVTAGGVAEQAIGAAKGFSSAVVIAIGTGLAASIILDGKIYRPHSAVGELGHVPTRNNRPCVCGKSGCLEMTCSGGALSRNYEAATGKTLPAHEIIELAEAGEKAAKELWDEFLSELGFSIRYIAGLLGPEAVVIAGGFGYLGNRITDPINKYLDEVITIQKRPQIITSSLEGTSGCIGAGLSAIASFR